MNEQLARRVVGHAHSRWIDAMEGDSISAFAGVLVDMCAAISCRTVSGTERIGIVSCSTVERAASAARHRVVAAIAPQIGFDACCRQSVSVRSPVGGLVVARYKIK